MKALIELNVPVQQITGWNTETIDDVVHFFAIIEDIPNSAKITQIEENEFDVCPDFLLWVDCNNSITMNDYYYDTSDSTIKPIVNATQPE